MTITINLSPDEERRLRERAALTGLDVETCVHEILSQSLARESSNQVAGTSAGEESTAAFIDDADFDREMYEEIEHNADMYRRLAEQ